MSGLGKKGVGARYNRPVKCRKDQFSALNKNPNTYLMRFMNQKHTKNASKVNQNALKWNINLQ